MKPILGLFDIVIANEGEAAQLTAGSRSAAGSLHASGVRTAIITLGARGALIMDDGTETLIDAPQVTAIDTSGAGDVFAGTLAGLLANGVVSPRRNRSTCERIVMHARRARTAPELFRLDRQPVERTETTGEKAAARLPVLFAYQSANCHFMPLLISRPNRLPSCRFLVGDRSSDKNAGLRPQTKSMFRPNHYSGETFAARRRREKLTTNLLQCRPTPTNRA
jgi:hypothetical protein